MSDDEQADERRADDDPDVNLVDDAPGTREDSDAAREREATEQSVDEAAPAERASAEPTASEESDDADDDARSAPLSELATGVREREASRESDQEFDELFSEVDVGELDGEQAWRDLLAEEEGEPLAIGERVQTDEDRDVRVIENRTCHNCQYFGEPPELHCTHEGTDIRRVVDTDHYEVVDCPMVVDEEEFDLPDAE
ncbi:hypothetical protein [Salarchaeum japonicum]|uniref:DUF8135 domain-containing protein n=1 Tax=Salarchaeum japonicum TaxID=555573 RepID=A0AAV3SZ77_9EURY|nr:hypothetical protein [Salarchaeum japonicum]